MMNKQSIVIKDKEENEIITISGSTSSYVDSAYFKDMVGEDPQNKDYITYGVNYHCVRADWILSEDGQGILFMKELLRQKRSDLFDTMYIKIITAFLYKRYSKKIMRMMLPSYLIHMVVLFIYLNVSEWIRDHEPAMALGELGRLEGDEHEGDVETYESMVMWQMILMVTIVFLLASNTYIFIKSSLNHGWKVFTRLWSLVDFGIITLNLTLVVFTLFGVSPGLIHVREIEAFLMILMWFKSLYYLALVGAIAPLVNSIFTILQDIGWFMVIYIILLVGLINSFYVIGRN